MARRRATRLAPFVLASAVALAEQPPLAVVPNLDFDRYSGTWYEIARLPNRFQDQCTGDVTATYDLREDGRIGVTNRCAVAGGRIDTATGVARRVAGQPPSVLKVRFAPAFLGFLPMVWGDYQVIALGEDYNYAVIGTPNRKYLWILARRPTMETSAYQSAVETARAQGFETSALVPTSQSSR